MPVSEAQKKASANWNRSKDNIMIRPDKEKGQCIRRAASIAGQSVQQYVLQAVDERMERDNSAAPTTTKQSTDAVTDEKEDA